MQPPNTGMPTFLENSPQMICDQVLWLIKNSKLNFQARETPFSLTLSIKKRFANLWDQNQFSPTPVSAQISPESFQDTEKLKHQNFEQQNEALQGIIINLKEVQDNLERELFASEQARKKLTIEKGELQRKHEKVCGALKQAKNEFENLDIESRKMSVALESSKKSLELTQKASEKKIEQIKFELDKLNVFKNEKVAEERVAKKVAKKTRQRQDRNEATKDSKENPMDAKDDDAIKTDIDYNIPVANMFNKLQNKDSFEFLDEDNSQNDGNADHNSNKPPSDISKHIEHILEPINSSMHSTNNSSQVEPTNSSQLDPTNSTLHLGLTNSSSLDCDQKYILPGVSCFTSTPSASSSSAVNTSAVTSSSSNSIAERIQCDQCSRKCVGKRDMEHHIYLWHTDRETQILMSRNFCARGNFV